MKAALTLWAIMALANIVGAETQSNAPARTPEELGHRVAWALIKADTNGIDILIAPYEAFLPLYKIATNYNEAIARQHYFKQMTELKSEVGSFPSEFTTATSSTVDQINGVDVLLQKSKTRTNWTDVEIVFKVNDLKFFLNLDECLCFSNAWYLTDLDSIRKEK